MVVVAAAVLASCSSTAPKAAPAQTSATGASSATGPPLVSFETSAALAANGPLATGQTAASTCGSNRSGWLAEIAKVGLSAAKVSKHWAFLEPLGNGITGRQLQGSGTITSIDVGNVDVPFDHPFAGDMSFNEKLDSPYVGLSRNLGVGLTPGEGDPRGVVHDELMTGLMPHPVGNGSLGATSTWPQYATNSAKTVTQAFVPRTGDRVAVMGYWVVDCGHTDFHTELHSVTFMAYGHRSGSATVAHAFFNPYEEAQLYNPDLALAGLVSDPSRLDAPATQNILKYLVTAIVRVASGQDKQATLPVLVEPNLQSPAPWTVCAPPGTRGGRHSRLSVSYRFSARPGVDISVTGDPATGCAQVTTTLPKAYRPADVPGQRECPTSWSWLQANALAYAPGGGGRSFNLEQEILDQVKQVAPQLVPRLEAHLSQPVLSTCFSPLVVPDLGTPAAGHHSVTRSPSQAMPFAGWVRVTWN